MLVAVAVLVVIGSIDSIAADGPLVETNYGTVRGLSLTNYQDLPYDAFLGVPFAQPPVDELRFEKPEELEPWEGIYNATEYAPHCVQVISRIYSLVGMGGNESEDCLYLDIYIPNSVDYALEQSLPVMVWIYGGGFTVGTIEMYPGQDLAIHGDVIYVAVNYRLSALGFLATGYVDCKGSFAIGDEAAEGNYGIWDGRAGLEWVRDNIQYFGGDPSRVTIFGESAGGTAVTTMMISPVMQDLFHRVLSMSGGIVGFSNYRRQYLKSAQALAASFNCTVADNQEMVDCLRTIDATRLVNRAGLVTSDPDVPGWSVVVDGELLPEDPNDMFANGAGSDKDFVTGHCYHDNAGFLLGNFLSFPLNDSYRLSSTNTLNSTYQYLENRLSYAENVDELIDLIEEQYPEILHEDMETRTIAMAECTTDWSFGYKSYVMADDHVQADGGGSRYQYKYQHRLNFLHYPEWVNGSHFDDIYPMLGPMFMGSFREFLGDWNEADYVISEKIMSYYTNFAHTGDPNEGPNTIDHVWPEYDQEEKLYLTQTPSMATETESDDLLRRYRFWAEEFYDHVIFKEDETQSPESPLLSAADYDDEYFTVLFPWNG